MIEPGEYLEAISADARAAGAAISGGLETPVRACPGWTVANLAAHLGHVHRWAARMATASPGDRVPFGDDPMPESPGDASEWLLDGAARLAETLASVDPDAVVPTLLGPGPASFWIRRQCHETMLHRWDAEDALGLTPELDSRLAADGIDEFLAVQASRRQAAPAVPEGTRIQLSCTDHDLEGLTADWHLSVTADHTDLQRRETAADVALVCSAEGILLGITGRVPLDQFETIGDIDLLDKWRQAVAA